MAPDSALNDLQSRLGHSFQKVALLERALTHPSHRLASDKEPVNNQRLEFLGDAVLQLVLSEVLFQKFPDEREGGLSRRRAILANGTLLAELAREVGLDQCLKLGASEETSGGRDRTSSLEDALEAVIGAVYLDAGLDATRGVIRKLYGDFEARLAVLAVNDNPKGRLQEWVQPRHGNTALSYDLVSAHGEDHARTYVVSVSLLGRVLGSGQGTSKKLAEEAAARMALANLQVEQ